MKNPVQATVRKTVQIYVKKNTINAGWDIHLMTTALICDEAAKLGARKIINGKGGRATVVIGLDGAQRVVTDEAELQVIRRVYETRGNVAKPINFGIGYGSGEKGLTEDINYNRALHDLIIAAPIHLFGDAKADEPGTQEWRERQQWNADVLEVAKSGSRMGIDQVAQLHDSVNDGLPDMRIVQDSVGADLCSKGETSNIFGRRCLVPVAGRLRNCEIDIEPEPGLFFRGRIELVQVSKQGYLLRIF